MAKNDLSPELRIVACLIGNTIGSAVLGAMAYGFCLLLRLVGMNVAVTWGIFGFLAMAVLVDYLRSLPSTVRGVIDEVREETCNQERRHALSVRHHNFSA